MTLEDTIKAVRSDLGEDIVLSGRFVGALKDYRAFDDEELYVENIFVRIVADGHIKEILSWKRTNSKKYIANSDSLAGKIAQKYALQPDAVLNVIHKISIGLGIIDSVPTIQPNNSHGITNPISNLFSSNHHPASQKQPASNTNTTNQSAKQQNASPTFDIQTLLQKEKTSRWSSIVNEYPIPDDRNSFIQLVRFLKGHCNIDDSFGNTCKNKLDECRKRAIVIYANDWQVAKMLNYGAYEKAKKIAKVIVWLTIVSAIIVSIVMSVSKCSRERAAADAAAMTAFKIKAKASIDFEEHRLDSLVNNLPEPNRANYMLCANKVKAIVWYKVDCGRVEELIQYQNEKRNKMRSRVNEYIFKLQKLEPNQWTDHYTENERYVKNVEDWSVFKSW